MAAGGWVLATYVSYLVVSVVLTVWVAHTLQQHGQVFLVDVFGGDTELAASVNRLLAVGFYLVNIGYVTLALRVGYAVVDARGAVETLATKVGAVALVLGGMHFANLYVFNRLRRRAAERDAVAGLRPPVAPDGTTPLGRAAGVGGAAWTAPGPA